jgi:hypothetical protein
MATAVLACRVAGARRLAWDAVESFIANGVLI